MDGPDHDALPAGLAQHLDDPFSVMGQRAARQFACVRAVIRAGHTRVAAQTLTDYATSRVSWRQIVFTFTY